MREFRVVIVGLGQLGRHHAMAAGSSDHCQEIWGFDVSPSALKAFQSLRNSLRPKLRKKFVVADKFRYLPRNVDLLIMSTTADARGSALASVLEITTPSFILLEKPLSSSREEFELMRRICPDGAYVNFPRRYSPLHIEAVHRVNAFPDKVASVAVSLPRPTLLSNTSHHIDFVNNFIDEPPSSVAYDPKHLKPVRSEREGFWDIAGRWTFSFPTGVELVIDTGQEHDRLRSNGVNCRVQIGSEWVALDEGTSSLSSSAGEKLSLPGVPLQSDLTGHYLEELSCRGFLNLPTFHSSSPAHNLLLNAVARLELELDLHLPFT